MHLADFVDAFVFDPALIPGLLRGHRNKETQALECAPKLAPVAAKAADRSKYGLIGVIGIAAIGTAILDLRLSCIARYIGAVSSPTLPVKIEQHVPAEEQAIKCLPWPIERQHHNKSSLYHRASTGGRRILSSMAYTALGQSRSGPATPVHLTCIHSARGKSTTRKTAPAPASRTRSTRLPSQW